MSNFLERMRTLVKSKHMLAEIVSENGRQERRWSFKVAVEYPVWITQPIDQPDHFKVDKWGRVGGVGTTEHYIIGQEGLLLQSVHFHVIQDSDRGSRNYEFFKSIGSSDRFTFRDHNLPQNSAQAFREKAANVIDDIENQLKLIKMMSPSTKLPGLSSPHHRIPPRI